MPITKQGPIAVIMVMALLWPFTFAAPVGKTMATRTLDRDADPVIVTGATMPGLASAPLAQLFVYAFRGGQWQQIPWQFDEKKNGEYVAADNGQLDAADELVFMGRDCGDQVAADNWIGDANARSYPRYEIKVVDPLDAAKLGWVYVYRSTSLTTTATQDYVSFDYATSVFTTPIYKLGFFRQYLGGNRLELNGSGVNVLDRSKFRLKVAGQPAVTEESLELGDPQPLILDGRVRAIAGYQELGQGILTIAYRSQFYDVVSVDLSWAPVPFEWASATADFNQNMAGGTYYDANTPAGVPVDGVPDTLTTTPASFWQQISGATGTVLHADDVSPMQGTPATYYKDSATADPTDTGDKKSYGEMGIIVTNPIKYLYLKVTHYILPPNQPNVGAQYYGYFAHPLQAQASEQWLGPQPTATATRTPLPSATPTRTPTPQPALVVSPASLAFLTAPGGTPHAQTVTVANGGAGTLAWTATESAAWLQIAPQSGNVSPGSPAKVTVNVVPGTIGRFETDVTISGGPGALHSPQKVHVVLVNQANLKRMYLPSAKRP